MRRGELLLEPELEDLNHGSYGACTRPVFEEYQFEEHEANVLSKI
jgi:hypothetical protein